MKTPDVVRFLEEFADELAEVAVVGGACLIAVVVVTLEEWHRWWTES